MVLWTKWLSIKPFNSSRWLTFFLTLLLSSSSEDTLKKRNDQLNYSLSNTAYIQIPLHWQVMRFTVKEKLIPKYTQRYGESRLLSTSLDDTVQSSRSEMGLCGLMTALFLKWRSGDLLEVRSLLHWVVRVQALAGGRCRIVYLGKTRYFHCASLHPDV